MGIETELDGLPAETLGGLRLGVSPLEMTNAYATLASGGIRNKPIAIRKVTFPDGHIDELGEPERERVFPDGVAYEVTQILEDNVDAGTGTAAGTGCGDEAGKTGTTDDFNDAMFMGYTPVPRHRASGSAIPTRCVSMSSVHGISVAGGTFPAQIWHDFMAVALDGHCETFPEPKTRSSGSPSTASTPPAPASSCSDGRGRRHRQLRGRLRLRRARAGDGRGGGQQGRRRLRPGPRPEAGAQARTRTKPSPSREPPPPPPPPVRPGGGITP